jgi:hypothetical protein
MAIHRAYPKAAPAVTSTVIEALAAHIGGVGNEAGDFRPRRVK